jgi:hypothetical protein
MYTAQHTPRECEKKIKFLHRFMINTGIVGWNAMHIMLAKNAQIYSNKNTFFMLIFLGTFFM